MIFLKAQWQDLILLNYAVPDSLLEEHLPTGLDLDRFQGSAWVSLVAFEFLGTRVLGVKWPGHVNFNEINLRFYVRRGDARGVCFIREFVPQKSTALLARMLYNEPYISAPISSLTKESQGLLTKSYSLRFAERMQRVGVTARTTPIVESQTSPSHWFKEHEWGYGRSRAGNTTTYRVSHPEWKTRVVTGLDLDFTFAKVYGERWHQLDGRLPDSTVFAVGSEVSVSSWSPFKKAL